MEPTDRTDFRDFNEVAVHSGLVLGLEKLVSWRLGFSKVSMVLETLDGLCLSFPIVVVSVLTLFVSKSSCVRCGSVVASVVTALLFVFMLDMDSCLLCLNWLCVTRPISASDVVCIFSISLFTRVSEFNCGFVFGAVDSGLMSSGFLPLNNEDLDLLACCCCHGTGEC